MGNPSLVTFTSDFGNREHYVASVKGVILTHAPASQIIDISHRVSSHDLLEAAFTVACAYDAFPVRTIHLVVVDPGVGSARRAIIAASAQHVFVAPDNGVLSLVYQKEEITRTVQIDAEHYYRHPVSPTFHGRDIFAPVTAQLARGIEVEKFGPVIEDPVQLNLPPVSPIAADGVEGIVLHIDKFGNIISSITPEKVEELTGRKPLNVELSLNGHTVDRHCRFFAEGGDGLFSLVGSSGYYEIAALKKPAARATEARRGMKVHLKVL